MLFKIMHRKTSVIFLAVVLQMLIFFQKGISTETVLSPEMTVKIYFDAYIAQDWEVVTEYLHPDLLENLKDRIIEMLGKMSETTRKYLLEQYHAATMEDLRLMSPRQLYVLYLHTRWTSLDSQAVDSLSKTKIKFIKTVHINTEECLVEFKSSVSQRKQSFSKMSAYHLKKFNGKWKIFNTEGLKQLDIEQPSIPNIL